jgi:hypothetical protein
MNTQTLFPASDTAPCIFWLKNELGILSIIPILSIYEVYPNLFREHITHAGV